MKSIETVRFDDYKLKTMIKLLRDIEINTPNNVCLEVSDELEETINTLIQNDEPITFANAGYICFPFNECYQKRNLFYGNHQRCMAYIKNSPEPDFYFAYITEQVPELISKQFKLVSKIY